MISPMSGPLGLQPHGMRLRVFNRSGAPLSVGSVVHTSFTHSGAVLDPEQSGSPLYVFNCVRQADGKVAKTNGYIGVVTSLLGRSGAPGGEVEVQFGGLVKAKVTSLAGHDLLPGTRLRASDTEEAFADDASDLGDFTPAAILMQRKDVLTNDLVDVFVPDQYWTLETFDNSTLQMNFLSGQLPSGLTFTRGSTNATYLARPYAQNLNPTSNVDPTIYGNGTVVPNSGIAPDGSNTAKTIRRTSPSESAYFVRDVTFNRSVIWTTSIYIKNIDTPAFRLDIRRQENPVWTYVVLVVNLSTYQATITEQPQTNTNWTMRCLDHGVVAVGNGWYRVWLTVENIRKPGTSSAAPVRSIGLQTPLSGQSSATTLNKTMMVWGFQCNEGYLCDYIETSGTALTYGQMQTIGNANEPRFEIDPVTREPLGMLMEDGTTNMLLRSQEFATSPWTASFVDVTNDGTFSSDPMGTGNAFTLATNTPTPGTRYIEQSVAVVSSGRYTISVYLKKDLDSTQHFGAMGWINPGGTDGFYVSVNLNTGEAQLVTTGNPTGISTGSVETRNVGNGWWRVSASFLAMSAGNGSFRLLPSNSLTQHATTQGNAARFFGAQMESINSTARPSSYIATGAGPASRNQDVCVMTGAAFSSWFNPTEGTFLFEGGRTGGMSRYLSANDNSQNYRLLLYSDLIDSVGAVVTDGTPQASWNVTRNLPFPTRTNVMLAYKLNDIGFAYNGTAQPTDTSATIPTVNRLHVGCDPLRSAQTNVRRVKYWPYRLPNAVLANLT